MASTALIINQQKDPTSTLTLRSRMIKDVNARLAKLRGAIRKKLIEEKFLGGTTKKEEMPPNVFPFILAKYVYERSDLKVDQFMDWLKTEESKGILEVTKHPILPRGQQAWSDVYVRSSYQAGLANARAKLRAEGVDIPSFDHYPGGIAGVMNQPFHADRVGLVYTRVFNEMKGVTEAMNQQLSRALAKGMAEGKGPYQIATDMIGTKKRPGIVNNIGRNRARLVARTEIVQAHNEGALNEFESAESIIGEEILVQWWSALDERVRPKHDAHTGWHGQVMTREEGRSRIGAPNCRCALLPWVPSHHDVMPGGITPTARSVIGSKLPSVAKLKPKLNKEKLERQYLGAKEKYEESIKSVSATFASKVKLHDEMINARLAFAKTFSKAEMLAEKTNILEKMVELEEGVKMTKAMRTKLEMASNWVPLDILYDLERRGGQVTIRNLTKRRLRAYYDDAGECILAKDDTGVVFAHELSHMIDGSFYESKGVLGRTGFGWADGKFVAKEDGYKMRSLFKNHHSGRKGLFTNGDGYFWEDNWISNYEGRIYRGGTGQEWWAVNCERYANYRYRIAVTYDIEIEKQTIEIARLKKQTKIYEKKVEKLKKRHALDLKNYQKRTIQAEQKLDKLVKEGAEEWSARLSKWKLARKKYPGLTDFIEEKFGKDFVN